MKPKNVLIYCPVFLPQQSGYSHAFSQLVRNLLERDILVDIVTPQLLPNGMVEPLQHPLLRIFRYKPQLAIWLIGLIYSTSKRACFINKLNKKYSYDLVWVETGDDPLLFAFLGRKVLHKMVVRFHSTSDTEYLLFSKAKQYRLRKFIWRNISAYNIRFVCSTNAYHLGFAIQHLLKSASILYSDVCINAIENTAQAKKEVSNDPTRHFVMLGRMDKEGYKQKGFDLLLQALPMLNNTALNSNIKLTIIGSGEHASQFKKAIASFSWVEHIDELQHDSIKALLQQSEVVVMPSRYEGLSVFALEALEAGLAFVMSDVGGLRDLWANNGWLVSPINSKMLGEAMLAAMSEENLLPKQQQSIQLAQKCFTKDVQWQQFLNIWKVVQIG